jgi:hypothetical protein
MRMCCGSSPAQEAGCSRACRAAPGWERLVRPLLRPADIAALGYGGARLLFGRRAGIGDLSSLPFSLQGGARRQNRTVLAYGPPITARRFGLLTASSGASFCWALIKAFR